MHPNWTLFCGIVVEMSFKLLVLAINNVPRDMSPPKFGANFVPGATHIAFRTHFAFPEL
jgi:hypothetical protein